MSSPLPLPFDLATRVGAIDRALNYITRMIDLKRVKPGEKLPSAAALSVEIGVNRPAVLEALKVLEKEGKLKIGLGVAGVTVLDADGPQLASRAAWLLQNGETVVQMALIREILEPAIVERASTLGMKASELRKARLLVSQMRQVAGAAYHEYLSLDIELHDLIASAASAPLLKELSQTCRAWVEPAFDLIDWPEGRRRLSTAEHEKILTAIESRDRRKARESAEAHVSSSTVLIQQKLNELKRRATSNEKQIDRAG